MGQVLLPKNPFRQLCEPTGHSSNWATADKIAGEKHRVPLQFGCSTRWVQEFGGRLFFENLVVVTIHQRDLRPARWSIALISLQPRLVVAVCAPQTIFFVQSGGLTSDQVCLL